MSYLFLIIALVLNALANILMKLGAVKIGGFGGSGIGELAFKFVTNWMLVLGVLCFAMNVIFYILALSKINISIAYPLMTSGGFLIITAFSFIFLKEPITGWQIFGILLVAVGITFIAYKF